MTKTLTIGSCISLFIGLCCAPLQALELVDKQLEFYGVMHMSLDYLDSDVSRAVAKANTDDKLSDGELSLSSNISRVGFKGQQEIEPGLIALFQLEQTVHLDGNNGDTFTSRNSFVGLRGRWGELLVGRYDTPFKTLGTRYSVLIDTVADRGAILGAGSGIGEQLNRRAENMAMWQHQQQWQGSTLSWVLQFSADAAKSNGNVDNNDRKMWGAGAQWQRADWRVALAHDHWSELAGGTIDASRIGIRKSFTSLSAGLIYEFVDHDLEMGGDGALHREAFGANLAFTRRTLTYLLQVMHAKDAGETRHTGATAISLGLEKHHGESLKSYAVYTQTDNDRNAAYQGVDGTHGDELATTAGGRPSAFSMGLRFVF